MTIYNNSCIAIGNFDGIHKGHDILINDMIEISKFNKLNSMILTFKYSDMSMKKSASNIKYLNSFDNKIRMLKLYKPDNICYIDLNSEVSKYSPEKFIKDILIDMYDMKHVVVGYNFRFGRYAYGNTDTLRKYSSIYRYDVSILQRIKTDEGLDISSTIVRDFISHGKINQANELLTNNFTLFSDEVDFTSSNKCIIYENSEIISPCDGKYPVMVGDKKCIVNIETVNNNKIFTFNKDIIAENITFLNK